MCSENQIEKKSKESKETERRSSLIALNFLHFLHQLRSKGITLKGITVNRISQLFFHNVRLV